MTTVEHSFEETAARREEQLAEARERLEAFEKDLAALKDGRVEIERRANESAEEKERLQEAARALQQRLDAAEEELRAEVTRSREEVEHRLQLEAESPKAKNSRGKALTKSKRTGR